MSAFLDDAADLGPGASGVPVYDAQQNGASSWSPGHLADVFSSADQSAQLNSLLTSGTIAAQEAAHNRNAAIQAATGVQPENPYGRPPLTGTEGDDPNASPLDKRALQLLQQNDPSYHQYEVPPLSMHAAVNGFREQAYQEQLQGLARQYPDQASVIQADTLPSGPALARQTAGQAQQVYGQGGVVPWLASTAGSLAAIRRDPVQVAALALGGVEEAGAKVLGVVGDNLFGRMMAKGVAQGLTNAGVQAAEEPMMQDWKSKTGQATGVMPALGDVGMASLFGLAGGALHEGVATAFRAATGGSRAAAAKLAAAIPADVAPELHAAVQADTFDRAAEAPPPGINPGPALQAVRDAVRAGEGEPYAPLAEPAPIAAPGVTDEAASALVRAKPDDPFGAVLALSLGINWLVASL